MKNIRLNKIIITIIAFITMSACTYLDKMPDEMLTIDMVFNNKVQTEEWLAGVYSAIPDPYYPFMGIYDVPARDGLSDDMAITPRYKQFGWYLFDKLDGSWNPTSYIAPSYWTKLPQKIRSAQIFIENVKPIQGSVTQERADNMKYEARFLIAYYYYLLIDLYGTVPFTPESYIPVDAPMNELMGPQRPFDEIVDWLDKELKELSTLLPASYEESEYGRATSIMCLAVRARMLLFAASPLVNGNQAYKDFVNAEGEPLFNSTYDNKKWEKAANASKELIDLAESNGKKLYTEYNSDGTLDPFMSYMNMMLKAENQGNTEILFARPVCDTRQYDQFLSPKGFRGAGSIGVTQSLVDAFFMKNGLSPIVGYENNDKGKPIINAESGYSEEGFSTVSDVRNTNWRENEGPNKQKGLIAAAGTYNMYVNREPRFYISVMWNGEWYRPANREVKFYTGDLDGGPHHDSPVNGYLLRKKFSPETDLSKNISAYRPGILFRLGEAYLNYAEALNESDPGNPDILKYLNMIRERAGIPTYGNGAGQVPLSNEQNAVRQAIRKERRVELNNEGIRYSDVRRWLIGEEAFKGNVYGMNFNGTLKSDDANNPNAFFVRTPYMNRIFRSEMYWFPIPQGEIDKNDNLTQNPGW